MRKIFFLALVLVVTGCNRDPVAEVPGHLTPGPSIDVARAAIGSGAGDDGATIGSTPSIDWDAPNVPLMQDGVVDVIWFVPQESRDGEALRDAHYVYIKVSSQSFTLGHANNQKTLLNTEDDPQRTGMIPNSARLPAPAGASVPELPFTTSGAPQTRVTVVDVDPTTRRSIVVGSSTVPGSANTGSGPVTNDAVNRMIENFNAAQATRSQTPSATTSAPSTGTTPVKVSP